VTCIEEHCSPFPVSISLALSRKPHFREQRRIQDLKLSKGGCEGVNLVHCLSVLEPFQYRLPLIEELVDSMFLEFFYKLD
jgi:hypothetical protein